MGLTEKQIIDLITLGQPKAPRFYGVGDDAAVLRTGCAITQDTMIEGIHFDDRLSPADIGWKIVAINASDIASMGRYPDWATLSISVPENIDVEWITEFSKGMRKALKKWNILLIGGDTTRSRKDIVISMAMGSRVGSNTSWRSGAQVGDDIWVTGYLGNAAYAFFNKDSQIAIKDLQRPEPPVLFAAALVSFDVIHAMTDLSDGLHIDLTNICQASDVGAIIEPNAIPQDSELYQEKNALAYKTAFGEDYQMLFTAFTGTEDIIRQTARLQKVKVSKIGTIIPESHRIELRDTAWPEPLFSHFAKRT